jgi:hypothetical protein
MNHAVSVPKHSSRINHMKIRNSKNPRSVSMQKVSKEVEIAEKACFKGEKPAVCVITCSIAHRIWY